MQKPSSAPVIIITGPTAVGKTAVGLRLAQLLGGEIISADSVQVYRTLDVGSDKLPFDERMGIAHHLIDIAEVSEDFNAGDFFDHARAATADILSRGKVPIIVGGTGLYLKWFVHGKALGERASPQVMEAVQKEIAQVFGGLLNEAAELLRLGGEPGKNMAGRAIGYRQAMEFLQSHKAAGSAVAASDLVALIALICAATHKLVRNQMTWFRDQPMYHWMDVAPRDSHGAAEGVMQQLKREEHAGGNCGTSGRLDKVEQKAMVRYRAPAQLMAEPAMVEGLLRASQAAACGKTPQRGRVLTSALISLYWPDMLLHSVILACNIGFRLVSTVLLHIFLVWLTAQSGPDPPPESQGWLLALALGGVRTPPDHTRTSDAVALFDWARFGSTMGIRARLQVIAAVHAKALRLNSACVSAVSTGFVVNLVSNDVRRFDDAFFFLPFMWGGPLELSMVLLMVSLNLGVVPAFAGVAAAAAIIPLQAVMVRPVGALRRATALCTDERVKLCSEAISGALAMKMLGWEAPLSSQLAAIRRREGAALMAMASIRAVNMAIQFGVTPIISFITFATYRAMNGQLDVPRVFYALALLSLPRRSMSSFVQAVQALTEVRVSLQRVDRFLSTPEPPQRPMGQTPAKPSTHINPHRNTQHHQQPPAGSTRPSGSDPVSENAGQTTSGGGVVLGTVRMRGGQFDWARPMGHSTGPEQPVSNQSNGLVKPTNSPVQSPTTPPAALGAGIAGKHYTTKASVADAAGGSLCALSGVEFTLRPGELLGVCGEVGAGKSTLLAALLGDLLPCLDLDPDPAGGDGGRGRDESESDAAPLLVGNGGLSTDRAGYVHHHPHGESTGGKQTAGDQYEQQQQRQQHRSSPGGVPVACGPLAYCCQVPWIMGGTVRENIVFGSAWDPAWYASVIGACDLGVDIAGLEAGDATELGERGINLSGGQKARVALARACYSRAGIQLLDDPLSAVDPNVGRVLFAQAICGLLKGCSRILVTHQRHFLPSCDRVLVLRAGRMVGIGTWEEVEGMNLPELAGMSVSASTNDLQSIAQPMMHQPSGSPAVLEYPSAATTAYPPLSAAHLSTLAALSAATASAESPVTHSSSKDLRTQNSKHLSTQSTAMQEREGLLTGSKLLGSSSDPQPAGFGLSGTTKAGPGEDEGSKGGSSTLGRLLRAGGAGLAAAKGSLYELSGGQAEGVRRSVAGPQLGQLVLAEGLQLGRVSRTVYSSYCCHVGLPVCALIAVALLTGQASYLAGEWWLSLWANVPAAEQLNHRWLIVYASLSGAAITLGFLRSILFFRNTVAASTRIHDMMVTRVLRAPLSFFHTNPAGRILNRFSSDLGRVDEQLPNTAFDALQCGLLVLGAFTLVSIAVPLVMPAFVPLALIFSYQQGRYLTTSREVKRWEAVTRSPVFATFSNTLKGLPTIRAYMAQQRFHAHLLSHIDVNGAWQFGMLGVSRWVGMRLDVISGLLLLCSALLAVALHAHVASNTLALALTHVVLLTGVMQWFVRQASEVENSMTGVERMLEYTTLPTEPPLASEGGGRAPPGWPRNGALSYHSVTASYRPSLPPVLRGITFSLPAGTSCGVAGRTGSGKSSLLLTLFRLIDVNSGVIRLDGVDIASVGLDTLRAQLAIIPQDPVLFSGSCRSNLDPWGRYADQQLWEALASVQLKGVVEAAGGLMAKMAEAGDNLSVGQRQLFCLARALLQKASVLALDEATANVDRGTDAMIQQALRDFARGSAGAGRSLLIIAHRIDTILDCDHILAAYAPSEPAPESHQLSSHAVEEVHQVYEAAEQTQEAATDALSDAVAAVDAAAEHLRVAETPAEEREAAAEVAEAEEAVEAAQEAVEAAGDAVDAAQEAVEAVAAAVDGNGGGDLDEIARDAIEAAVEKLESAEEAVEEVVQELGGIAESHTPPAGEEPKPEEVSW
ncbi:MAG: hypothetical protein WDW38_008234 [Sanguina aurantia]